MKLKRVFVKLSVLFLFVVLSLSLSFTSFATYLNHKAFRTTESYYDFLSGKTVPDDFIWLEEVSFLGTFYSFHGEVTDVTNQERAEFIDYSYFLEVMENEQIVLRCNREPLYYTNKESLTIIEYLDPSGRDGISFLKTEPEEDLRYCSEEGYKILMVGELAYCYLDGQLSHIVWKQTSYAWIHLNIASENLLANIPEEDFLYQFYFRETVQEAQEQLFQATRTNVEQLPNEDVSSGDVATTTDGLTGSADVTDSLPESDLKWWHIALPVGGGIAVVGSLAAVLLLRKKKK